AKYVLDFKRRQRFFSDCYMQWWETWHVDPPALRNEEGIWQYSPYIKPTWDSPFELCGPNGLPEGVNQVCDSWRYHKADCFDPITVGTFDDTPGLSVGPGLCQKYPSIFFTVHIKIVIGPKNCTGCTTTKELKFSAMQHLVKDAKGNCKRASWFC